MTRYELEREFRAKFWRATFDDWDPYKFDWQEDSVLLAYCFHDYFDIWWDPILYNWQMHSWALAQYCSEHFNKWWDPKKFHFDQHSITALFKCCRSHKHKWFHCIVGDAK